MATYHVYTCPPGNQQTNSDVLTGRSWGSCSGGAGKWEVVEISSSGHQWFEGSVDVTAFGQLLSACTVLLAFSYSVHLIVRMIRGRR